MQHHVTTRRRALTAAALVCAAGLTTAAPATAHAAATTDAHLTGVSATAAGTPAALARTGGSGVTPTALGVSGAGGVLVGLAALACRRTRRRPGPAAP